MRRSIPLLSALILCAMFRGPAAAADLPSGSRYVSLGSSYAAGPGVGVPDAASAACARSQSNFARQVAAARHLVLVDAACSGATTTNILVHGQHGFPAQIEAVTADTRLVTILIGGNDVDYVGNLGGLTCRDTGGQNCKVASDQDVDRRLADLPGLLRNVVAAVRSRAPGARIVMIGYLPAIPATGPGTCAAVPLTAADAERMRAVAVRLAQAIGGVAAQTGSGIVRSTMIGTQHDACAAAPYIAGASPPRNPGWPGPVAYHPTQAGMDRVAAEIETILGH